MSKEAISRRENQIKGSVFDNGVPRVNWTHHIKARENFSCQEKFLSEHFLYSLSKQKPNGGDTSYIRPIACNVQHNQKLQTSDIDNAWNTLHSLQKVKNDYVRPGFTEPSQNHETSIPKQIFDSSKNKGKSLDHYNSTIDVLNKPGNLICDNLGTYHYFSYPEAECLKKNDPSSSCITNSLEKNTETSLMGANDLKVSLPINSTSVAKNSQISNNVETKTTVQNFLDDLDDDEIMKNIDVDQIILEYYRASGTTESSKGRGSLFTCPVPGHYNTDFNDDIVPTELSQKCTHGVKLEECSEVGSRKPFAGYLIVLSNQLIDNVYVFGSQHREDILKRRILLNNKILNIMDNLRNKCRVENTITPQFLAEESSTIIQSETLECTSSVNQTTTQNWNASISFSKSEPEITSPQLKHLNIEYTDGSIDKKWKDAEFPWNQKLEFYNKEVFGNHSFRRNQREVINATMSGCDVFVLMPTGGGKSLTYQIPALISTGVTLVISPLVSLIEDQIMHLLQANIPATFLSASIEWCEQQEILRDLNSKTCKYKLLSDVLIRQLEMMNTHRSLARIVIDEAHCVSQWGHDFRPDYQGLGILKQKFPSIPVLALTATATASVREDIVQALGLKDCIVFRQSFNRPNLWYTVIPKTNKCLDDIDKFINENHFDECGIIYCLSRMDCEKVAEKLQACGHKVSFYHGSMDHRQRTFVQKQWSKNEINIICATVAFGMGINKPNVRFVIHHSLPKSIEGYHQECGRAGRDGQQSSCLLYYTYSDYIRVKNMLSRPNEQDSCSFVYMQVTPSRTGKVLEANLENVLRMVDYCENNADCRRHLQLVHLGEKFDPKNCLGTCDNCSKSWTWIEKDVTNLAKQLVDLVKTTGQRHSSSYILELYKGSLSHVVKKYGHDGLILHGVGKHLAKGVASRVLHHLVVQDFVVESVKRSDTYGSISSILKVNQSRVDSLLSGKETIMLRFPISDKDDFENGRYESAPAKAPYVPNFRSNSDKNKTLDIKTNVLQTKKCNTASSSSHSVSNSNYKSKKRKKASTDIRKNAKIDDYFTESSVHSTKRSKRQGEIVKKTESRPRRQRTDFTGCYLNAIKAFCQWTYGPPSSLPHWVFYLQ
ncbi:ATP-dependent DNA helicase Q-like 4A [Zostera marina]|uniref:DNA 3'-5' helicase n=1 Tax=Zostera marina TaxID=29655 RepID=A0A0K9NWB4_ZOSMR|nr:ATP-dependent DNA helicase Q-like 4A [Zostera marina]